MVQLLFDSLLAPVDSSATTVVRYSSHELDPFSMAGGLDSQPAGRCALRRDRFRQADGMMQQAEQFLLKSDLVSAAEWVMCAHFCSEGLLELSHKFQSMVLEHDLRQPGIHLASTLRIYGMCVFLEQAILSCLHDYLQIRL